MQEKLEFLHYPLIISSKTPLLKNVYACRFNHNVVQEVQQYEYPTIRYILYTILGPYLFYYLQYNCIAFYRKQFLLLYCICNQFYHMTSHIGYQYCSHQYRRYTCLHMAQCLKPVFTLQAYNKVQCLQLTNVYNIFMPTLRLD